MKSLNRFAVVALLMSQVQAFASLDIYAKCTPVVESDESIDLFVNTQELVCGQGSSNGFEALVVIGGETAIIGTLSDDVKTFTADVSGTLEVPGLLEFRLEAASVPMKTKAELRIPGGAPVSYNCLLREVMVDCTSRSVH